MTPPSPQESYEKELRHVCHQEQSIGRLQAFTESNSSDIRELFERVVKIENTVNRHDEMIKRVIEVIERIENVVTAFGATIQQWTGSVKIMIWIMGTVAAAFVGTVFTLIAKLF